MAFPGLYIKLIRPHQWIKNLMLFFPPFLGGALLAPDFLYRSIVPFMAFCLASSSTYVLNDIFDKENDRHHPRKCRRPLASGEISIRYAFLLFSVLLLSSLGLSVAEGGYFFIILAAYLLVSLAYSLRLKEIPIVDLFCIAAGFLLRLEAGGVAFDIRISEWLFLSVFLLAIFLSTGKRLSEKRSLGVGAGDHRKCLAGYPDGFLDGIMYMTGAAVLVTYTMYAIARHSYLIYTVPLCCFGLMRYILLIMRGTISDPTESLLKDFWLLSVSVTWAFMVTWGIYFS